MLASSRCGAGGGTSPVLANTELWRKKINTQRQVWDITCKEIFKYNLTWMGHSLFYWQLGPEFYKKQYGDKYNCLFVLGRLLKNTKVGLLSSRELLIGGNTFESNFDCELSLIRRKLKKRAKYSCRARFGWNASRGYFSRLSLAEIRVYLQTQNYWM